jgi:hypothetical protein
VKPKYSEKSYPSASLSTTNPTLPDPGACTVCICNKILPYITHARKIVNTVGRAIINDFGHNKLVTDKNTNRYANSIEINIVYLEMFNMCSLGFHWLPRYSISSHVPRSCDSSALALACKILSRRFGRDCGIGGWYTWSFTCPHR